MWMILWNSVTPRSDRPSCCCVADSAWEEGISLQHGAATTTRGQDIPGKALCSASSANPKSQPEYPFLLSHRWAVPQRGEDEGRGREIHHSQHSFSVEIRANACKSDLPSALRGGAGVSGESLERDGESSGKKTTDSWQDAAWTLSRGNESGHNPPVTTSIKAKPSVRAVAFLRRQTKTAGRHFDAARTCFWFITELNKHIFIRLGWSWSCWSSRFKNA